MHPQPEIFQAELAKVLPSDGERIEVVLIEVPAKLAAAFLVFSPGETCREKKQRRNDRGDDVDAELALQSFDHKFPVALERVILSTATSAGRERA